MQTRDTCPCKVTDSGEYKHECRYIDTDAVGKHIQTFSISAQRGCTCKINLSLSLPHTLPRSSATSAASNKAEPCLRLEHSQHDSVPHSHNGPRCWHTREDVNTHRVHWGPLFRETKDQKEKSVNVLRRSTLRPDSILVLGVTFHELELTCAARNTPHLKY